MQKSALSIILSPIVLFTFSACDEQGLTSSAQPPSSQNTQGNPKAQCSPSGGLRGKPQDNEKNNQFLVQLNDSAAGRVRPQSMETHLRYASYRNSHVEHLREDLFKVSLSENSTAAEIQKQLGMEGEIAFVEPDSYYYPADYYDDEYAPDEHLHEDYEMDYAMNVSGDPLEDKQWAHKMIQSYDAWEIGTGSEEVVVAVIDTGVDYNHPDLKENIWRNPGEVRDGIDNDRNGFIDDLYGWNFQKGNASPLDDHRHGTHVAGTIGARGGNGIGITGHAPNVRLMALKGLGGGSGGGGRRSDLIRAIDYAVENGAHIINASWGSFSYSEAMVAALSRAERAGVLFVAASGNSGVNVTNRPFYPASYGHRNIISVGSTGPSDTASGFSNYSTKRVHIGAPGASIHSTVPGGKYISISGTSMASPLVAGVAALMKGLRPDLHYREIRKAILETADRNPALASKFTTSGRINAYKAMREIELAPEGDSYDDEGDSHFDRAPAGSDNNSSNESEC
jgi:subtilisin family serine protease